MKLLMRILLPTILLLVLLLGFSSYFSYTQSSTSLEASLMNSMEGEANSLLRALQDFTVQGQRTLTVNATRTNVQEMLNPDTENTEETIANANKDLNILASTYPDFDSFIAVDATGHVLASSEVARLGSTVANTEYFTKAMAGETGVTLPFKSTITQRGVMMAYAPVKIEGKTIGVLLGTLSLKTFFETYVNPVVIGTRGYAYLIDPNGNIIAHKNSDLLFRDDLPQKATFLNMATKKSGTTEMVNVAGNVSRLYFETDETSKLTAVVQAEMDDVFSGLYTMRNASIGIVLGAIFLGILVVFAIVYPIVGALNQGMQFATQIAAGNLGGTLKIHRTDEIGTLADALRAIPEALKRIIAEYSTLEKNIEGGKLDALGDASGFTGEFASLINGTNSVLGRFRIVLESMTAPVIMLDKNQHAIYINSAGQALVGAGYAGKTCAELFAREDVNTPADALRIAVKSQKPAQAETRAHPGGKAMDIAYAVTPLYDASGNLVSVLQLITDLTSIKGTQRTIVEVATQALDISNRVATAAEELSAQVEQVSRGTEVQRDRVGSTATAMEEMNATVLEVARSAGQASEQAENTRERASYGSNLVAQVIEAITQVDTASRTLLINMEHLNVQAESIGGVMSVISDIADQTNLLALNAAIEAARAGDAGRGFAVVADEVRKLAEKTMTATTEVGSNIQSIQTASRDNMASVQLAADSSLKATELASTSGKALKEIVDFANQNSSVITSIATAAEEQSATSDEINHSIEEINRIAADTADGMTQSSSAVQELAQLAQELNTLLDRLRV